MRSVTEAARASRGKLGAGRGDPVRGGRAAHNVRTYFPGSRLVGRRGRRQHHDRHHHFRSRSVAVILFFRVLGLLFRLSLAGFAFDPGGAPRRRAPKAGPRRAATGPAWSAAWWRIARSCSIGIIVPAHHRPTRSVAPRGSESAALVVAAFAAWLHRDRPGTKLGPKRMRPLDAKHPARTSPALTSSPAPTWPATVRSMSCESSHSFRRNPTCGGFPPSSDSMDEDRSQPECRIRFVVNGL